VRARALKMQGRKPCRDLGTARGPVGTDGDAG